jgi:hypothetical protein
VSAVLLVVLTVCAVNLIFDAPMACGLTIVIALAAMVLGAVLLVLCMRRYPAFVRQRPSVAPAAPIAAGCRGDRSIVSAQEHFTTCKQRRHEPAARVGPRRR